MSLKHSLQLHQSLRMCRYITQFYLEVYHHNQNSATKDYFPFSLRAQPLGCKKLRSSCLLYVDVLNILAIFQNETNQFSYLQLSPRRTTKNVMKCFSSCLDSKKGVTQKTGIQNYNPKSFLLILSLNLSHACHKNTSHQVHLQPLLIFVFCE